MQHQPTRPSQICAVSYIQAPKKQIYENPADDPEYEPERQCLGFTIEVLILITHFAIVFKICFQMIFGSLRPISVHLLDTASWVVCTYFHFMTVYDPKFCGGKPAFLNFWTFLLGVALHSIVEIHNGYHDSKKFQDAFISKLLLTLMSYFVLFQDDTSDSCCLSFKPWVYKKKTITPVYPSQMYGHAPNHTGQNYGQAPYQAPGQYIPSVNPPVPVALTQPPPYYPLETGPCGAPRGNPPKYFGK